MQDFHHHRTSTEAFAARARANALRSRLAGDRMLAAFDRFIALARKAGFNEAQPRIDAGRPGAGQWGDDSAQPTAIPLLPDFLTVFPEALAGAAGGLQLPSLADPPSLPADKPSKSSSVTTIVRESASWLQTAKDNGASSQARGFFNQLLNTSWLRGHMPRIISYLDDPKSEAELQDAVSNPRAGFATHHRNERAAAIVAGYPKTIVNGRPNLMLVPEIRHWDVTGWYMSKNADYGGLSPRDHLVGKDWATRTKIGNKALRLHGILKP